MTDLNLLMPIVWVIGAWGTIAWLLWLTREREPTPAWMLLLLLGALLWPLAWVLLAILWATREREE